MSFTLVQAGASLYAFNTAGGATAALTLPTGVTLVDSRVPRFARFKNYVVVVNTPSRPITVDTTGNVRVLTPTPPSSALAMSSTGSSNLTGFFRAQQTYINLDSNGNLISESDFGPLSTGASVANAFLQASNINISADSISATRLYRTTDNGAVMFKWIDVDGNSNTAVKDNLSDAGLGILAAGRLGTAPDLTLIASYAGRLFGVARTNGDNLLWSEAGQMYAWPTDNTLPIPAVGDDRYGITALMPRRDSLGVGRRNQIIQVTGNQTANFRPVVLKENCGVQSQESVVRFRDVVYFLSFDGVYRWDDSGVICISDNAGVRSWFTTDKYFNRGMFSQAFAVFNVSDTMYRLFLCSPNSVVADRYVEFDIGTGKWFGPHKTDAFSPSSAFLLRGTNDQPYNVVGSRDGYVSIDTDQRSDWGIVPIAVDIVGKRHHGGDPDRTTVFGQPTLFTEPESSTMRVTPTVGSLKTPSLPVNAVNSQVADLSQDRIRLFTLGAGRHAELRFTHSDLGKKLVIFGYEIPLTDQGRR